jgi:hypothetical protein
MVEIETPYPWMANLTKVPLIGGVLVLLIVLVPATVPVSLVTVPLGVSTHVGTGLACLVAAAWALVLQYRFHTTIRLLFIPVWLILPVLGVLGICGVLD